MIQIIFGQDDLAPDAEDFENPVDDIVGWQSDGHVELLLVGLKG